MPPFTILEVLAVNFADRCFLPVKLPHQKEATIRVLCSGNGKKFRLFKKIYV